MCQRKRAPRNLKREVESTVCEARENCTLGHSLTEQSKGVQGGREFEGWGCLGIGWPSRAEIWFLECSYCWSQSLWLAGFQKHEPFTDWRTLRSGDGVVKEMSGTGWKFVLVLSCYYGWGTSSLCLRDKSNFLFSSQKAQLLTACIYFLTVVKKWTNKPLTGDLPFS